MEMADRRTTPTSGAEPSAHEQAVMPALVPHGESRSQGAAVHAAGSKRKVQDIYDEGRLAGFIDDASAIAPAVDKVLDKASSAETSKKVFLRSQIQQVNKELVAIAEATYLDMLSKILTQTPELLDAVFQTDRSNKILESLAEKVHKQLPDDLVEAEQQSACLEAVVTCESELGQKTQNLTEMMVEYMIDCSRKERRAGDRPRAVHDPPQTSRSHRTSHP
eukprot:jgi/Ulvmu1/5271/UM022_0065.1